MVDASVATRFLLKEDLAEQAERVLRGFTEGEIDLASPQLVIYEVGNALRTAASRGFIKLGDAEVSFEAFLRLKLGRIAISERGYSEALGWSIRKGVSYY